MTFFAPARLVFFQNQEIAQQAEAAAEAASQKGKEIDFEEFEQRDKTVTQMRRVLDRNGFDDAKITGKEKTVSELIANPKITLKELQAALKLLELAEKKGEKASEFAQRIAGFKFASKYTKEAAKKFLDAADNGKKMDAAGMAKWLAWFESQAKRLPKHLMAVAKKDAIASSEVNLAALRNADPAFEYKGRDKNTEDQKWGIDALLEDFDQLPLPDKIAAAKQMESALQKLEYDNQAEAKRDRILAQKNIPTSWREWLAEPEKNGDSLSYAVNWIESVGMPELQMTEKKFDDLASSASLVKANELAREQDRPEFELPSKQEFLDSNREERREVFDEAAAFLAEFDKAWAEKVADQTRAEAGESQQLMAEQENAAKFEAEARAEAAGEFASRLEAATQNPILKKIWSAKNETGAAAAGFANQFANLRRRQAGEVQEVQTDARPDAAAERLAAEQASFAERIKTELAEPKVWAELQKELGLSGPEQPGEIAAIAQALAILKNEKGELDRVKAQEFVVKSDSAQRLLDRHDFVKNAKTKIASGGGTDRAAA